MEVLEREVDAVLLARRVQLGLEPPDLRVQLLDVRSLADPLVDLLSGVVSGTPVMLDGLSEPYMWSTGIFSLPIVCQSACCALLKTTQEHSRFHGPSTAPS